MSWRCGVCGMLLREAEMRCPACDEEEIERLRTALEKIAGTDPNVDGIHWVGDELNPELCPGCIARAALDETRV